MYVHYSVSITYNLLHSVRYYWTSDAFNYELGFEGVICTKMLAPYILNPLYNLLSIRNITPYILNPLYNLLSIRNIIILWDYMIYSIDFQSIVQWLICLLISWVSVLVLFFQKII
jgi:hypothetical protein